MDRVREILQPLKITRGVLFVRREREREREWEKRRNAFPQPPADETTPSLISSPEPPPRLRFVYSSMVFFLLHVVFLLFSFLMIHLRIKRTLAWVRETPSRSAWSLFRKPPPPPGPRTRGLFRMDGPCLPRAHSSLKASHLFHYFPPSLLLDFIIYFGQHSPLVISLSDSQQSLQRFISFLTFSSSLTIFTEPGIQLLKIWFNCLFIS